MPDVQVDPSRGVGRRLLARLLTKAARGELLEPAAFAGEPGKPAKVVAVTGAAGVGKSTLIGKVAGLLRSRGRKVAVLACDPESPLSGGALLGDRLRMAGSASEPGIFIRSLAAPPGRGGIADHMPVMIRLLETHGFDTIFIETVGAGQGDTTVNELADATLVLVQPETGDELQWEKAGILEIADVVVVHKGDLPTSAHTEAQVRAILDMAPERAIPVLRVSSRSGEGLDVLSKTIEELPERRSNRIGSTRALLNLVQARLSEWPAGIMGKKREDLARIASDWHAGSLSDNQAVAAVLGLFLGEAGAADSKSNYT